MTDARYFAEAATLAQSTKRQAAEAQRQANAAKPKPAHGWRGLGR